MHKEDRLVLSFAQKNKKKKTSFTSFGQPTRPAGTILSKYGLTQCINAANIN